ncbi:hypothetical protein GCM10027046_26400 [Uliginosibacterium flavum]|uniref:Dihydrodipicolinate reductase n=1 Tax=Uliginosibacterium flavum TaxID=1396831 RepID=A0ABV2TJZ9_9RHOO
MDKAVIIVAGTGKLARELLGALPGALASAEVIAWADAGKDAGSAIVVHAGSGRELEEIICYCQTTKSTLVELATGSEIEQRGFDFPVVLCPNTNILMLKFMAMLAASGSLFRNYQVSITESHQAEKSSVPGTAVALAQSLGVPSEAIRSIRDPQAQQDDLKIPAEYLARHAFHRIEIEDQVGRVVLETSVFGPAPYAEGLAQIIAAIRSHTLENRRYSVMEFIENGWV